MRSSSAGISIAIHLIAVLLMSLLGARVARETFPPRPSKYIVPLTYSPPSKTPGGGGTGDPLPPSRGAPAPRPATPLFVPPLRTIANPQLPVNVGVIDSPVAEIRTEIGDPLGRLGVFSLGPGARGGLRGGEGGGDGPGRGPGSGPGGQQSKVVPVPVRVSTPPRLLYKIDPEYPDEARKARFQGTVVVAGEVDAAGRPRNMRVVRGAGLGLDERALAAVALWRFAPAIAARKPVAAPVEIEVTFRLL